MFSHFLDSLRHFFTGSPLELGLIVVAAAAVAVALRVRAIRSAAKRAAGQAEPPSDVTPIPTARQWLARETAMNDLPPLRESVVETHEVPVAGVLTSVPPAASGYESRPVDEAIVFPSASGFGDYRTVDLPPPRELPPPRDIPPPPPQDLLPPRPSISELPEAGTLASILSEGLDDLATGGDRLADAIRERPVQYFFGALAAGFAAGLMFPMVYGQQRVVKLLERLIESNEELKHVRLEDRRDFRAEFDRREAERFRQSRPS